MSEDDKDGLPLYLKIIIGICILVVAFVVIVDILHFLEALHAITIS